MKASTERRIITWFHLIASIPVAGYIYGPVSQIPEPAMAVKIVIFPSLIISGLWLWKGHIIKRYFKKTIKSKT